MTGWLPSLMPHLIVVPVLLPLLAAASMLLMGDRRRMKVVTQCVATTCGLLVAIELLAWVDRSGASAAVGVYLPSNWEVPFGIVLAVDRLSAMMLVLTGVVSLASVIYATSRWDRAGVHYHALVQIQLMGVNGAFLTGDLFNLFVFFEVMLAASYGLLLHGSGRARVRAGLHYLAVNVLASSLFLVGVAILYGVTGTLNMADMAQKIPHIAAADRGLLNAGAAILGIAFLVKAAMWPLNFWLLPAYAAASAPVAALFAILTKVGIYAVLRLWTLFSAVTPVSPAPLGGDALVYAGFATLAVGAIGMLGVQQPRRLAAFAIVVSSGTLLAVTGFARASMIGGALFYLVSSTLAASALFLLAELIERSRETGATQALPYDVESGKRPRYVDVHAADGATLAASSRVDDPTPGRAIPGAMAFLGLGFIACALLIAGLPPSSGFLAKFTMLDAVFASTGRPAGAGLPLQAAAYVLVALLLGSSLLSTIALSRAGIRYFWAPQMRAPPALRVGECVPVAWLLSCTIALTVFAGPVSRYTEAAATSLLKPAAYLDAVMSATPVPGPSRARSKSAMAELR